MTRQFLFVVLSVVALGCETAPSSAEIYNSGTAKVEVVAPDGRTFLGSYPAAIEIRPAIPNAIPNGQSEFTLVVEAGSNDAGRLYVAVKQPADAMSNPGQLDAALNPKRLSTENGANAANENGPIASGSVHLELRAARMTGRVDTPEGAYTVGGSFTLVCFKSEGDSRVVDENHETPLCQRFASLYPSQ